jgi:uncharacterized RDD family membrane protein YckC
LVLADIRKRAVASLIDYFLFIVFDSMFLLQFGDYSTNEKGQLVIELSGFVSLVPLLIWMAKTLGKKIMKIRVVREDGERLDFFKSFQRRVFDFVDFLLFGLPAIIISMNNKNRKRLGDWVARTIVVEDYPDNRNG